jgi:hypothetical protein
MSGELVYTANFLFTKNPPLADPVGRNIDNLPLNVSSGLVQFGVMHVLTTEGLVPMGNVTSPGFAYFYNSDPTNYIQLYADSGGTPFLRLKPGWPAVGVPLDPGLGITKLYAKANTGACDMEYVILSQ